MGYLVGTDEAGYGPNLGPLVISATVWQVPEGVRAGDLYRLLEGVVAGRKHGDASHAMPPGGRKRVPAQDGLPPVVIADSKVLYRSGKGLGLLERGLLPALGVLGRRARRCREVWDALAPDAAEARRAIPWYADHDRPLPQDAEPGEVENLGRILQDGLAAAGVRLLAIRSRAIFEEEFNRLVQRHESKGTALSHATLELVAEVLRPLPGGPIAVLCDKHGGRDRYGPLLGTAFPQWLIEVCGEGRQQSVYRFGPPERRVEVRFQSKAESHLPAALASMASKYLRELAMQALNDFWRRRVPGLVPTAGYPADARRFKTAIAAAQAELGIEDRQLWRCK